LHEAESAHTWFHALRYAGKLPKGSAMGRMMEFEIRPPRGGDADLVSRLILWALGETNGKDYSCDVIERVGLSFSPDAVRELFGSGRFRRFGKGPHC
jgi:hypothetical protein